MKKILPVILLLTCCLGSLHSIAQTASPDKFFVSWEIAFPNNDLVSKASFSGGRLEYRRMIKPNFSIGIGASWNSFEQYAGTKTYQAPSGNGAVTTDAVKDIYTVPVTISGHYYLQGGKHIKPYIGVGLGTQYSEQDIYYNIYGIEDNNWGFCVRPEIGFLVRIARGAELNVGGFFNYATNKSDDLGFNHLQHFGINIGFAFP
ncbi:OmpW family outer membrane protein [Deminuibacter soli]|uniref:Outer membrane protein beta-barrel domain-containing protein n=1 Tax=Deminuibacter soli TaxID=2291815 RepID=A0A3E1NH75_9BACT|nr:OmpW family outer membrane protein [Deminuibacter soli]RFM27300.1 hypothetical protein DXN05_14830 [Deminuibacter soli]